MGTSQRDKVRMSQSILAGSSFMFTLDGGAAGDGGQFHFMSDRPHFYRSINLKTAGDQSARDAMP
jgi:hypothetical protein